MAKKKQTLVFTLEAIKILLSKGWTRFNYAVDKADSPVNITSPDAVSFCLLGALKKINGPFQLQADEYIHTALPPRACNSIVPFNDRIAKSVKPVLRVLDKAIARAKADTTP